MRLAAAGLQKAEQAGSGRSSMQLGSSEQHLSIQLKKRRCQIRYLAVNLSFTQVSSCKMELVSQYLSAHVFITAHRTHKDTCFSRDAAFGEVTT